MYFILKYYVGSDKASILYVIQVGFLPFILKDSISVVLAYIISLRLSPILDNMQLSSKEYIEKETKM
jgi:biotin transporter BioY